MQSAHVLHLCPNRYKWVAQGRLGINPRSIILAADSSGGHLAVGVCVRAIQEKVTLARSMTRVHAVH